MTSKSELSYAERAATHRSTLVQKLFQVAERKRTNIVLSADLTVAKELLHFADGEPFPITRTLLCSR